jgi:hypothetical protein
MKSEELRLGNWVMYNDVLTKIYSISLPLPSENKHFDNKEIVTLWCNGLIDATCDEIEPIKLTEHMLLDNGFSVYFANMIDPNKSYSYLIKDKVEITIRPFYNPSSAYDGIKYKYEIFIQGSLYQNSFSLKSNSPIYVHELQNAYYLVNKQELDFKL